MATKIKRWSQRVTESSDAMTLQHGILSDNDPRQIARSIKRSSERSRRRKTDAFRSAMSMLNFYINRAGKKLPAGRKHTLERRVQWLRPFRGFEINDLIGAPPDGKGFLGQILRHFHPLYPDDYVR